MVGSGSSICFILLISLPLNVENMTNHSETGVSCGQSFEIVDLGVNVSEEQFINAIRENKSEKLEDVLSVNDYDRDKSCYQAMAENELRDKAKIIVGEAL